MSNNDKLAFGAKLLDDLVELVNIGIVQWSIYFVKNTEGCRFQEVNREE